MSTLDKEAPSVKKRKKPRAGASTQHSEDGRAASDHKIGDRDKVTSASSSRKILTAPGPAISRLSKQLLANIFLQLPKERGRDDTWEWVAVLRVCKLWRDLALKTPKLWSHITLSSKLEKIVASLELSRTSPLTVRLTTLFGDKSTSDAYKLVLKHLPRIYELELSNITIYRDKLEKIHATLSGKAPLLQKLCFRLLSIRDFVIREVNPYNYWDCSKIIDATTSLKYLNICGITFNWSTRALKDLTVLTLDTIPLDCMRPTIAQLLDRKSTRLNSSHSGESRMPSSA